MQIKFTEEEKKQLLKEFNYLENIKQKFDFWEAKLNQPYISFLFLTSSYYYHSRTFDESEVAVSMEDFILTPKQVEFSDYNKLVFDQFKKHFDRRSVKIPLFDLEAMKKKYFEELENAINKEIYIDYQITQISNTVAEQKKQIKFSYDDNRAYFFTMGYEKEYLANQEPDLNSKMYDYVDLIYLINGNTLAKFQKWLISELNLLRSKAKEKQKQISLQQQILILQFLGIFEKINQHSTITHKASFLASLLNKTPQSIRELYAEGIHTLLTAEERKKRKNIDKDLETVYELFVSVGLKTEASVVRKEKENL